MTDNISALAEYQEAHRNGHSTAGIEIAPQRLIKRASDTRSRTIKWAWPGRLALGYLSVWTGEEGLGKSVFAAWLAARVTRGELDGIWSRRPVDVLIVAGEDIDEDTWTPRLTLANADLERVAYLNLKELPYDWNVRDGIGALQAVIETTGAKLVLFDALLDHMPAASGGENINSPTYVRGALGPLKQLVQELGIVGIISMHPPKARGTSYRDLVQASQAFSAIPRLGLYFGWHPDDAEDDPDRRRVLVRGKGNIGRNPGALEFRVVGRDLLHDDGEWQEREVVVDVQPCDVTLSQLVARSRSAAADDTASKAEAAADLIRERLRDGEWHPCAPIREGLDALDLNSNSVVDRAKQIAGVEGRKAHGSLHGGWEWRIVSDSARSKGPAKGPISLAADSSAPKAPNRPYLSEESKSPPSVTADSWTERGESGVRRPACGHSARWWRLPQGGVWICNLCHPAPAGRPVAWREAA
jgi:AAA domain